MWKLIANGGLNVCQSMVDWLGYQDMDDKNQVHNVCQGIKDRPG